VFTCLQCLLIYFSLRKIMGFSDKDNICIKNLHDLKWYRGYGAKKSNETVSCRKDWSKSGLSCSVVSTSDNKILVWLNWKAARRRLVRSWTVTVDFWRGYWPVARKTLIVSVLKEGTSSIACKLSMLILSLSVTFSVTCLTVASLITKSCQQRWLIHSWSFYKVGGTSRFGMQ